MIPNVDETHPLVKLLGLSVNEILDVLNGRARLMTAVLGGVAEEHLQRQLQADPELFEIIRLDRDGHPDFSVRHRNTGRTIRIECKNVLARLTKLGPCVDFQKTRAAKGDPCSRYYAATQFEVLAACLHPITKSWEFRFVLTEKLAPHSKCSGKLATKVVVGDDWLKNVSELIMNIGRIG